MPELSTLLLSAKAVEGLVDMKSALSLVEQAFIEHGTGKDQMPPKLYVQFPQFSGDLRVMPAYLPKFAAAGVKTVTVHPGNRERGLPTVMATIILNDPVTGFPLAMMDGTRITNLRTGAGGGVAAKFLARPGSKRVGLIGAGAQARTQLAALRELFPIEEVRAWSLDNNLSLQFAAELAGDPTLQVEAVPTVAEACDADIVCTTTPSRQPIVMKEFIREGTHINAIGADAPGKQELDPSLLKSAVVVCDEWEQARHGGEVNVSVGKGEFSFESLHAELGQVVAGARVGRSSGTEITIFDSTGLAIQDIAVAKHVYDRAVEQGIGDAYDLIGCR